MNNTANENSSTASVDDSISQTAKLDLASSSGAETDVKDLSVSSSESAKKTEIPMPTGPKTRYEWYQTETHVVVSVLVKNVKKEDLNCDIQQSSLSLTIRLPTASEYSLELDLARSVVPEQSQVKILSSRVEVKLKKVEGWRWEKLENDGCTDAAKQFNPGQSAGDTVHKYPSSSHCHHNWDALEAQMKAEEKDEKLDGDAALNKLFQQIYADGNDETRRAMNKSFQESGGTVLSTNWKDIGTEKTECKPPDGMEFKNWEY